MDEKTFFNGYSDFVKGVTSEESCDLEALISRIRMLAKEQDVNIARLMTGGTGLGSEGGEFQEIVKKLLFQGKPFTQEVRDHLEKELGDIIWYWTQACIALKIDPDEVIRKNVKKLENRYPGGKFNAFISENRKNNDI